MAQAGPAQPPWKFLEPPPQWLFSKEAVENSPSRSDKVDKVREARYRREGANFIKKIGLALKIHWSVYYPGIVFFHRFYMLQSFANNRFNRWYMAAACLFLAGKVGEQPKKMKPLIAVLHQHLPRQNAIKPDMLSEKVFIEMKRQMLGNERVLLQQLCFDLSVENASTFLFKYARQITVNGGEKLNAEHNRALVKKAHELIDDSYKTCLCVEYPPQIIALALLHLATKFLQGYKLDGVKSAADGKAKAWYNAIIDANIDFAITDICTRVVEALELLKPSAVKPTSASASPRTPASPAMTPGNGGGGGSSVGGGGGGGGGGAGGGGALRDGMPPLTSAVGATASKASRRGSGGPGASSSSRDGRDTHKKSRHY